MTRAARRSPAACAGAPRAAAPEPRRAFSASAARALGQAGVEVLAAVLERHRRLAGTPLLALERLQLDADVAAVLVLVAAAHDAALLRRFAARRRARVLSPARTRLAIGVARLAIDGA